MKWLREDRDRASATRRSCQYLVILVFTMTFKVSFVRGFSSNCRGCGSPYWRHSSRICINQDLEQPSVWRRAWQAWACRGSSLRWQIIENRNICLCCRMALAGRDPDRKYIMDLGVLSCSLNKCCIIERKCPSTIFSSDSLRTRDAMPDSRTGAP